MHVLCVRVRALDWLCVCFVLSYIDRLPDARPLVVAGEQTLNAFNSRFSVKPAKETVRTSDVSGFGGGMYMCSVCVCAVRA